MKSCSVTAVINDDTSHALQTSCPLTYLTLTCRDTYFAPKHSTIARDACTSHNTLYEVEEGTVGSTECMHLIHELLGQPQPPVCPPHCLDCNVHTAYNWRAGASLPSRTTGAIFLYIYNIYIYIYISTGGCCTYRIFLNVSTSTFLNVITGFKGQLLKRHQYLASLPLANNVQHSPSNMSLYTCTQVV